MLQKPELIMPAGNLEKLEIAYRFGADACYIGMPDFSLRYRENQITQNDLKKAIKIANNLHKKLYVTINTYPHNKSIPYLIQHLKFLSKLEPDALIFSDPGVYNLTKKYYPEAELHLSVQATATNYETVKFWQKLDVKRIILARELSLAEIKKIHQIVPKIELEVFVHGAICMAYSGRCLLSKYLAGRDANQGDCAHTCRWKYKVLEESSRPNQFFPIQSDKHGSYILSSQDLSMIEHLNDLLKSGVKFFKVEGRAKNTNYVATIARAYRMAIDNMMTKKLFNKKLLAEIKSVSNRSFFTGFYYQKPTIPGNEISSTRIKGTYEFVGVVKSFDEKSYLVHIELKNQIKIGDNVEILTPNKIYKEEINELFDYNFKPIVSYNAGVKKEIILRTKNIYHKYDILRRKIS